jgi:hypothetical protein
MRSPADSFPDRISLCAANDLTENTPVTREKTVYLPVEAI